MKRQRYNSVLAIYPSVRGFGFVLFEAPMSAVDWGIREVRGRHKNQRCLIAIASLLDRFRPDVLVLQDMSVTGTRRAVRLRELNAGIEEMADEQGFAVYAYSRGQVRHAFAAHGITNKHSMAEAIAKHVPVFERYVPPPRRLWMSEDARMSLFDAAALALTFFQSMEGGGQGIG